MIPDIDIEFYKRIYDKLNIFQNSVILVHWNKKGRSLGLLGSEKQFYDKYPDFDIDAYKKYNSGLLSLGVKGKDMLMKHYWHFGRKENRIIKEASDGLDLKNVMNHYKIKHITNLGEYTNIYRDIVEKYSLSNRFKPSCPILAVNPTRDTIKMVMDHDHYIYILLTSSYKYFDEYDDIIKYVDIPVTFCTQKSDCDILKKHNMCNLHIKCIVDTKKFINRPVVVTRRTKYNQKKWIYVNDIENTNLNIETTYKNVVDRYQGDIIYGNLNNAKADIVEDVSSTCFAVVWLGRNRPKKHIVSKLGNSNVPLISNMGGIKWDNCSDVINYIDQFKHIIDNKSTFLDKDKLDRINENLTYNLKFFNGYKNIMIISNDKPLSIKESKQLQNFIMNNSSGVESIDVSSDIDVPKGLSMYDLVVLKNPVDEEFIQTVDCTMFYVVSMADRCKVTNPNVLHTMRRSDMTFCADPNSVIKFGMSGMIVNLFYSNLLECYGIRELHTYDNVRDIPYAIMTDSYINVHKGVSRISGYKNSIAIGLSVNCVDNEYVKRFEGDDYDILKRVKNVCIDNRNGLYDVDSVAGIIRGCKIMHIRDVKVVNRITNEKISVLDHKSICLVTFTERIDYENIIRKYDFLGIKVVVLILTDITKYFHNSTSSIKYVDYANQNDLTYMYIDLIHKNIDLLILDEMIYMNKNLNIFLCKLKKSSRNVLEHNTDDDDDNNDNNTTNTINTINTINTVDITNRLFRSDAINKKLKIFINFKAQHIAYGGGNVFVNNLVKYMSKMSNIDITFELEDGIDVYFMIDIRKDRRFKRYSIDEIYDCKIRNKKGVIVYRVNDCDVTRVSKTREPSILQHIKKFDHMIFNSDFIKEYYLDKYREFDFVRKSVIYNTSDSDVFFPRKKKLGKKVTLVTHHWSDNINKGFDTYQKLYEYSKTHKNVELVFIGRKYCDKYKDVDIPQVHGPYSGVELAECLRQGDVYITASVYDACPMHVLEGLSLGLPILYIDHDGGGKNICEMSSKKVGESFRSFDEMLRKLNTIIHNYDKYYDAIVENINLYNSEKCYADYVSVFMKEKINYVS